MTELKDDESKVLDMSRYIDHMTNYSDEKAFDFSVSDVGVSNELWNEEVKAWADMLTIESLFFSEDWVYLSVDLLASKISSQPLTVMKSTMENGVESVEFADGHPLNQLIDSPNPMQDYHSWMYNFVVQYFQLGNAINWYSASNNWLVTLRTALMSVEYDKKGRVHHYIQAEQSDDNPLILDKNKFSTYDASEIIHIRRPNPASLMWGLTPFIPGRKSILFNRYSSDYLNSFYLKQATPGMILEMDRQVNEAQALRQLRSFELAYTGRKNQRRTMILPKGVKATPSSHSIADQRIVELVDKNRETILAMLKIPPHEVGLHTSASLGSEEYKTALRNFWEATLKPAMRMIEGGLNKFFKDKLGEGHYFQFVLDDVEALQDDQVKKAELAAKMLAGGLSVNEVRARVWDEEPVATLGADDPFILKPAPAPSWQSLSPENPKPIGDPPVENPTGEPPKIEDPPLEPTKVVESGALYLRAVVHNRRQGWVEQTSKALEDLADKNEGKKLEAIALETLTSMAEVAGDIIERNLVERKAADIPSKRKLKKDLEKAFSEFEESWTDEYTRVLSTAVDIGYDQQLQLIINERDNDKITTLRARDARRRRLILEERGIDSFFQISKTHTERIMAEITRGVSENDTVDEIAKRIANTFGDPEEMFSKARTIARTETLTAVSIGQGAALINAAEVVKGLKKAWLNSNDERVRDQHLDTSDGGVSGEIVNADESFSNGLRWPRDTTSGDPGQVINCRCTLILLPPE